MNARDKRAPCVRLARRADMGLLVQFNLEMARETEGKQLDPAALEAGVREVLEDERRGFYAVAEMDGQAVAGLMVTTEWSDWRNGFFWWIQSVYVLPAYRRAGLYRRLYEFVRELAGRQENVCGFRLYVAADNVIARRTYEALGMTETAYLVYEQLNTSPARIEPK